MIWFGMVVRKNSRAAEKSGEHNVAPGRIRRARAKQVGRDDSEMRPQFENVPPLAAHNALGRSLLRQRVTFARDRLDQRGFAAAVWPEDTNMFSRFNMQR